MPHGNPKITNVLFSLKLSDQLFINCLHLKAYDVVLPGDVITHGCTVISLAATGSEEHPG